jgi:general secretion pathway protein N
MKRVFLAACFLLGAACVGVVVLATQATSDDAVERRAGRDTGRVAAGPAAPVNPAFDQARRWEAALLARPLFNPDRRPIGQAPSAASADAGLPRLTGIMITPNSRSAIFAPAGGGRPTVVVEGGNVGDYVVRAISLGQVVLAGPDGSHRLKPTLDHMPTAGGSTPPVINGPDAVRATMPTETNP